MSESRKREAKRIIEILIETGVIKMDFHGQYHKQIFIIPLFTEEDLLNKLIEAIAIYQGEREKEMREFPWKPDKPQIMTIEESLKKTEYLEEMENDKVTKTGLHCYNCGENTKEEILKGNGMYYYRCQHCIDVADPNEPEPCPKCGCKAHERVGNTGKNTNEGKAKYLRDINNPFRPEFESYICLNCGYKYYTKEFTTYLATKTVREAVKKQKKE